MGQAAFILVLCFSFLLAHPFSPVQSRTLPLPTIAPVPVEFYVVIGGELGVFPEMPVLEGKATGLAALSAYLFHLHFLSSLG